MKIYDLWMNDFVKHFLYIYLIGALHNKASFFSQNAWFIFDFKFLTKWKVFLFYSNIKSVKNQKEVAQNN